MNKINKYKFLVFAVLTLLGITEVILELHKNKIIFTPYEIYLAMYYLRATLAVACIFLGAFDVFLCRQRESIAGKYLLVFIGVCFSFISIFPSVVSLYFSKGINTALLDSEHLRNLNDHVSDQKTFLKNIAALSLIYLCIFLASVKHALKALSEADDQDAQTKE